MNDAIKNEAVSEPGGAPLQPAEASGKEALLQTIGHKLSRAREAAGESIEEVVRKLKLQKRHLLALEQGDWNNMPDDVYMLGFLRQYSKYLHVDLTAEIERLKQDQYALTKPLTFPDPPVAPSRRWAWLAGIAFVLLLVLFNITTQNSRLEESDLAPVHQALQREEQADLEQIQPSPVQSDAPSSAPANHSHPTGSAETATTDAGRRTALLSHSDSIGKTADAPPQSDNRNRKKQARAPSANVTATAESVTHLFRFDAVNAPVWLQISRSDPATGKKGQLLKEVLLQSGFHTSIHEKTSALWVTCGNAPALRIFVDGHLVADAGALGGGKKVLRDFRFQIGRQ